MPETLPGKKGPDDFSLLAAIAARDPSALATLYNRYSAVVYSVGLRVLHDRSAAEELLIDVFEELWRNASRYDASRGGPMTYLVMLTRSRAIDRLRARVKELARPTNVSTFQAKAPSPLQTVLLTEQSQAVRGALDQLDALQREAIEIAFYEGLSHSEVAERLNKPLGTVKTYIRQGLIRLRTLLRTTGESQGIGPLQERGSQP